MNNFHISGKVTGIMKDGLMPMPGTFVMVEATVTIMVSVIDEQEAIQLRKALQPGMRVTVEPMDRGEMIRFLSKSNGFMMHARKILLHG